MKLAAPLLSCLLLVAASASFAAEEAKPAAAAPAKPDLAKGQTTATNVCAACHTSDGSRGSPANPILQGQHPDYLVKQLVEFKAGTRDNPIMRASGRNRAIARAVRPDRVQHKIAAAPVSDDACQAACVAAPVIRSTADIDA